MSKHSYSRAFYEEREREREKTGKSAFEYHEKVRASGRLEDFKCHERLNPHNIVRESRDHDLQPESLATIVSFDGTGSMSTLPILFQKKLPDLMDTLVKKGLSNAQILYLTHGDVKWDRLKCPQVGQFEMGNVMEDDLASMLFEGQGGSYGEEDYALVLYFAAYKTSTDCFEKRGKKGYLHLIGDERAYAYVTPQEIKTAFGDTIQQPISLEDLVKVASEKYEIFFYLPTGSSGAGRPEAIINFWTRLIGQDHVIIMEDPEQICDVIASTMVLFEGLDDLDGMMKEYTPAARASLSKALAKVNATASTRVPATKSAVMEGELVALDPTDTAIERL